jgi:hypothetical protein
MRRADGGRFLDMIVQRRLVTAGPSGDRQRYGSIVVR